MLVAGLMCEKILLNLRQLLCYHFVSTSNMGNILNLTFCLILLLCYSGKLAVGAFFQV